MKTLTVTWTTYNNYGTVLQAYALQQEILYLGHENVILNDKEIIVQQIKRNKAIGTQNKHNPTIPDRRAPRVSRLREMLTHPRKAARVVLARLNREKFEKPYYLSQDAVRQFKNRLLISCNFYPDNLEALNEQFDVFVAGSDQVWSLHEGTFNPFYFLDFATKRKIAYAPCLGKNRIEAGKEKTLRDLLSDFYAISSREKSSAEQLSALTGRDVAWVVDPTILRGKSGWLEDIERMDNPIKHKYLLCYFLENNPWYFEQVKLAAKKLGIRPVLIPNRWDFLSSEYVITKGIGPLEFVSLFSNAEFVLTDSYHGSIFSILFGRKFQYLERFSNQDPNSQNIRIQSLFGALDLEDLIVPQNGIVSTDPTIEWDKVSEKLEKLRKSSEEYLANSLS